MVEKRRLSSRQLENTVARCCKAPSIEVALRQNKGMSWREGRHHPHRDFTYPPLSKLMTIYLSNNFSGKVNPPHIWGVLGPGLELVRIRQHWMTHHNSHVRVGAHGKGSAESPGPGLI